MMPVFITFEGIEGSGKTTQVGLLKEYLEKKGKQVAVTREPGGTPIGDQIRRILLDRAHQGMTSGCELFLYAAARSQHIREVIQPALEQGKIVLCDRFSDATMAYQGYARGLGTELVTLVNQLVSGTLKPHLTFLLDCSPDAGLTRAKKRLKDQKKQKSEGRFEEEGINFHKKVQEGYLAIAKHEPERVIVVNADRDLKVVHREIVELCSSFTKKTGTY